MQQQAIPVLDVRSPSEFAQGHVPGALSFPLLLDDERAIVGRIFAKEGVQAAMTMGQKLLRDQWPQKLQFVLKLLQGQQEMVLYCWRGGLRSRTMTWLLEGAGLRVHVVQGGYRSYKAHVRASLGRSAPVLVLGGKTGCGKTELLHAMLGQGAQVIDLEALAGHRGSAFGGVGLPPQPTNDMFENLLEQQWAGLDFSRPVWVEDEDRRIGCLRISEAFFPHIGQGPLVIIDVPHQERVDRLLRLYAGQGAEAAPQLIEAIWRLQRRLGHATAKHCAEAVRNGQYAEAVQHLLGYYDKAYDKQMRRRRHLWAARFALHGHIQNVAAFLLLKEQELSARFAL